MYPLYNNLCIKRNLLPVFTKTNKYSYRTYFKSYSKKMTDLITGNLDTITLSPTLVIDTMNNTRNNSQNNSQKKLEPPIYHNIINTGSIEHISNIIKNLIINDKKRVLLACDVDDTLIHPSVNIGTDAWFYHALKDDHIINVRKKLGLIYALLDFNGVEKETNDFVNLVDDLSNPTHYDNPLIYICLTARCVSFHSYTTTHLTDSGYGNVFIRPNMLDVHDPLYVKKDIHNPLCRSIPSVRYIDNICSCSGKNKGDVLVALLTRHYEKSDINNKFDIVVFVDDSSSNIQKVHNKLSNFLENDASSLCIHYTFREEHKNSYSVHDFTNDSKKMDDLIEFKKNINSK